MIPRQRSGRALAWALCLWSSIGLAEDEPKREGPWTTTTEADGTFMQTATLTVQPADEPRPALAYRFIPDDFDLVEGNAAIHYLKAMGFLDEGAQRRWTEAFAKQAREQHPTGKAPPYAWLEMSPEELPLADVKEYLSRLAFQTPFLGEAATRRQCDWDRTIRDARNPAQIPIPEIISTRELARMQSLRCKVAVAEGRVDDAIAIVGQQCALARHVANDVFLVSPLVGIANATLALEDAIWLVQRPGAPNLYWAYATLPRPLVPTRTALAFERRLPELCFPFLEEVDDSPRPAGYWEGVVDRLAPVWNHHLELLTEERLDLGQPADDPVVRAGRVRAALASRIEAAWPGASRYLVEACGFPRDKVDALPKPQAVFLAMKRLTETVSQDAFKWCHLPYPAAASHVKDSQNRLQKILDREPWAKGLPPFPMELLPAGGSAPAAEAGFEQLIAMLQTVEAIRMHGARHARTLPRSLDDLEFPAAEDPVSGEPFGYDVRQGEAILTGHARPGRDSIIQRRITIRFAGN